MTNITYISPEKIRINGKLITIMSGSNEHLKDLTVEEQKDLSEFIISLHRTDSKSYCIECNDDITESKYALICQYCRLHT